MLDFFICLSTNLFRILLTLRYIQYFFADRTISRGKSLFVCIIYYCVNTGLYLIFHLPWINAATNIIGIMALLLLYTKKLKKIFFITGIIYILNIVCDAIAVMTFADYRIGEEFNQFCTIITVLLYFLCEIIVEKIVNAVRKNSDAENTALLFVPISSIIILCVLAFCFEEARGRIIVVVSIGILAINFAVLFLYNALIKASSIKLENDLMVQKNLEYKNQIRVMKDSAERVKSLRHDMKNHLIELEILTKQRRYEDILHYLREMMGSMCNSDEYINTGNSEVDGLLNYWLQKANKCLKQVTTSIFLPGEIADVFDMSVILGNLLENAIEAAVQTKDQILDVSVHYDRGIVRIGIRNSFHQVLRDTEGNLLSQKKDKANHGIGLANIRKMVEKYNGQMEVNIKDSMFNVNIIMYL